MRHLTLQPTDTIGAAYVAGDTSSEDFPTANAFQETHAGDNDAFVAKFPVFPVTISISDISRSDDETIVEWNGSAGWFYNLQYCGDLLEANGWTNHATYTNIPGYDGAMNCTDDVSGASSRLYRIRAD